MIILKLLVIAVIIHVVSKYMNRDIAEKYQQSKTKNEILQQAYDGLNARSINEKRLLTDTIANLRVTIKRMNNKDTNLS